MSQISFYTSNNHALGLKKVKAWQVYRYLIKTNCNNSSKLIQLS
jgi:ArsR family metal-binding transcriptional regulator